MKRMDNVVWTPSGRAAPLRRATTPGEVGRALEAGVIVETDVATALACGACIEDCDEADQAFEATEDPADFGGVEGIGDGGL